jgi:tripartite-type tricarboxylate transporter receptor subunit TctC
MDMEPQMHRRTFLGLAAALAGTRIIPARAQSLAGKQIHIVVPFPPGGATDTVARPFAQLLGEALKATIVIDNRGGAGGSIGADAVAKSAPDGTTLLVGTVGTHAINAALYTRLPYDPVRDFTPLAQIAHAPVAIVVNTSQPMKSLADLLALAKRSPGKLNYGTAGVGTPGHLTAEMFQAVAGINIQHVPYKGGAPAITDLIGGQIQIMFEPLASALPQIQGSKMRPLAVSSRVRSPVLPDVPTIAELGYAGFETTAWWGIFAPAKLPEALAASLIADIQRVSGSDAYRGKLEPLGVTAVGNLGGAEFAAFQRGELAKWGKAVKDAGVKIE